MDKIKLLRSLTDTIMANIHDGIIITYNNFDIIYSNETGGRILEMGNDSANIIDTFIQLKFLDKHIFFNNRKITIYIDNNSVNIALDIIITSKEYENNIYHVFIIHNNKSNYNNSQKTHGNFIAYLSHEMRNPLQSINLANHLLMIEIKKNIGNKEKCNKIMSMIDKSCNELKKIIGDVLDLSKIEANEMIIEYDTCIIRDICINIIEYNEEKAKNKNLDIYYIINDNMPETIYTDEIRLNQILNNLISNAIKYTQSGYIKLVADYDSAKHCITFNVIDSGIGIKEDEIDKLFTQYSRTSASDKFTSNGLGLYISQNIANLLGGYIEVKSAYNNGSTFTIYHPINLEISSMKQNNTLIYKINKPNMKILLVDDNKTNLDLLYMMMEHINNKYKCCHDICISDNGYTAIELTKKNNFDIIFIDVNMPHMDGTTAAHIIKSEGYTGKIIATTGNILVKKENATYSLNSDLYKIFDNVIIKPYDELCIVKMLINNL